jgi:5'-deoxy-5'-methylthioadenosine phosphorylase
VKRIGIVVGSGALELDAALDFSEAPSCRNTVYGEASSTPLSAELSGSTVILLSRHGDGHRLAPHKINYRANVRLLADLGVDAVIAINTVGGIAAEAGNGVLVVPDQVIDYSWGREHTFATEDDLQHIDFTDPYDPGLRQRLLLAAGRAQLAIVDGGVYGCTQGPRFESPAEIVRMERDGCSVVGMTGMPEASLARELGLAYASVCLVVNPAAGKSSAIDLAAIADISAEGMMRVSRLLGAFLQGLEP